MLALGRTQRRAKQRGAARVTLEKAVALFEQVGAPLWAEQARAELARIGGRAPSGAELTEGERRIAELVAEGRTNREVAAALFLTSTRSRQRSRASTASSACGRARSSPACSPQRPEVSSFRRTSASRSLAG